jgi:hypothetical protein
MEEDFITCVSIAFQHHFITSVFHADHQLCVLHSHKLISVTVWQMPLCHEMGNYMLVTLHDMINLYYHTVHNILCTRVFFETLHGDYNQYNTSHPHDLDITWTIQYTAMTWHGHYTHNISPHSYMAWILHAHTSQRRDMGLTLTIHVATDMYTWHGHYTKNAINISYVT